MNHGTKTFLCGMFLMVSSSGALAQGRGIHFENRFGWKEILAKAKAERKFIFLDAFATWCGPCKMMDSQVYPIDSVGDFINAHFISVKVQMDTGKTDDPLVKNWYWDAHTIRSAYHIGSFPTLLFFSPDGNIVHGGKGYMSPGDLIKLGQEALDSNKQFYRMVAEFEKGRKDYHHMPYLALKAVALDDEELGYRIGKTYIEDYLSHVSDNELYTKNNIQLLRQFTRSSADLGFNAMLHHSEKINEIMKDPNYCKPWVDFVIAKEEVNPAMRKAVSDSAESPNWLAIEEAITNKYGKEYSYRILASAKASWYKYKDQWSLFGKYKVEYIQVILPNVTHYELNETAFDIFKYCSDVETLHAAIGWMYKVLQSESDSADVLPACMDTYANLLYKVGDTKQAISMEKKALEMAVEFKIDNYSAEFRTTLEKMKAGEPTWKSEKEKHIEPEN